MKATRIIIALILISFVGKSQNIPINSYWLAIESRPIVDSWTNLDGMILQFDSVELKIQHVLFDTTETYLYSLKNDTIFVDDTILCTVHFSNKDSLLLDFDNYTRAKYIPINQNLDLNSNSDFWKYEDYKFIHYGYESELKLHHELWGFYPNEIAKLALIQSMGKKYKYSSAEKWNIFRINNNEIFVFSYGQHDYNYYFVSRYTQDSVILSYTNQKDSITIIHKENFISKSQKDSICSLFQGVKWNSSKVYDFSAWWHDDEDWDGTEFTGSTWQDTMFFNKSSLENDRLMFYFQNDFTYEFFENDTLKIKGNWTLSKSGKQIVLNNGWYEERFIDIIALDSNRIMLGKRNSFWTEYPKRNYAEYYYKIELYK